MDNASQMNEHIILGMVAPYLKDKELTYDEFDCLFSMLSQKEKYVVIEVLQKNSIILVDDYSANGNSDYDLGTFKEDGLLTGKELIDQNENDFNLLYDDSLFSGNVDVGDTKSKELPESSDSEFLIVHKKVYLDNNTLIRKVQEGSAQAKQDLCIRNHGLVTKWAGIYHKIMKNKMDFEDLEQVGMLGMIKAAEKFDFNMGTEFSTYAVPWIRQAITREIMDNGYTVRIPVHAMEVIHKVLRYDSKFFYVSDYTQRMNMIAKETGMQVEQVEYYLTLYYKFIGMTSLDLPVGESEDTPLLDLIPIENETSIEDIVLEKDLRESLEKALSTLTNREQKILRLRFGLDDGRQRTLEEIGKEYNVTRERIRQIEAKALRKLRHPSRSKDLKVYLE